MNSAGSKTETKYNKPDDATLEENTLSSSVQGDPDRRAPNRAFQNEYWDNKREGIYVDVLSGNRYSVPSTNTIQGPDGQVSRSPLTREYPGKAGQNPLHGAHRGEK